MSYQMTKEDASCYSDLYKSLYGFRPRNVESFANEQEFDADMNFMQKHLEIQMDEEAKTTQNLVEAYASRISTMMNDHGIDYPTAVRWDMQAEGFTTFDSFEMEHYAWGLGLPLDMFKQKQAA